KLSWQETAASFRSSWDKVRQAVEYVVEWGLAHRNLGPIVAIGVDEIQYGKGHKYLTLVYQIEQECTRLLWVGKERTVESFEQFFTLIGTALSKKIEYVCSDMWKPYHLHRPGDGTSGSKGYFASARSATLHPPLSKPIGFALKGMAVLCAAEPSG